MTNPPSWPTYHELRKLSDAELEKLSEFPPVPYRAGPQELHEELARRRQDRYARQLTWLTVVIAVATLVNIGVVIYLGIRGPG